MGGPQGRSGRLRKLSPPLGFDPLTVKPVTIRYADWLRKLSPPLGFDPLTVKPVTIRYADWAVAAHRRFTNFMDCFVLGASVGGCSGGKNEHRVNNVQLLACLL